MTQGFSWRATFYFLAVFTGLCVVAFIFFKDTFRRERSLTYQQVLQRVKAERAAARRSETSSLSHVTGVEREPSKWLRKTEKVSTKSDAKVTFQDVEAQGTPVHDDDTDVKEIKLSLKDVNPLRPIVAVLSRLNNFVILFASGTFKFRLMLPDTVTKLCTH